MHNIAVKPFFTQLNRSFFALFFTVVISLLLVLSLFLLRDIQFQQINNTYIPQLKNQHQSQQLLTQSLMTIGQLEQSSKGSDFNNQYQNLQLKYKELKTLLNTKFKSKLSIQLPQKLRRQIVETLTEKDSKTNLMLERISDSSTRNEALLDESILLFNGLAALISPEIMAKTQQQSSLLQQVIKDETTDRVTVRRARAYGAVSEKIIELKQLKQNLTLLLIELEQLTIQTELTDFELLRHAINDFLAQTKMSFSEQTEQRELVTKQLERLENLLISQESMLAKWFGYLRLNDEFKIVLNNQKNILTDIGRYLNRVSTALSKQALQNDNYDAIDSFMLSNYQIQWRKVPSILLLLALAFIVIPCVIIFRIRTRIKQADEHTINMCEQLSEKDAQLPEHFNSQEDEQVAKFVLANNQPLHSESDYQVLLTSHNQQLLILAQNNEVAYWQSAPSQSLKIMTLWQGILADKALANKKSWRHYFNKMDIYKILNTARVLKKKDESSINKTEDTTVIENDSIILTTQAGKVVVLSIYYKNKQYFGTVVNADLQDKLNKDIDKLTQEIADYQQEAWRKKVVNTNELERMLLRALLQSQSVSIGFDGASAQVYRHLSRLLEWNQQQLLNEELMLNKHSLQLTDVSLKDEIHSAILNAMCETRAQRNTITLKCDPQLMSRAKLDSYLFQRLLLISCRLLLQDSFKASLSCVLKVIDKNAGQQVVRFSYQINSANKRNTSPELLQLLCELVEQKTSQVDKTKIPETLHYAQQLLGLFNGVNLVLTPLEYGFSFSYDLPLAASDYQQESTVSVNLKQANFLLISSQNKKITSIEQTISSANGSLEVLSSTENVAKRLTEEELTRKKIAVVLFEMNNSMKEQQLYQKYIEDLPVFLQPKLMVMQSTLHAPLHQQGFYSQSNQPLMSVSFLTELNQLQHSDKKDNCLAAAEIFGKESYLPTQVEVLLAVEQPEQHQSLMRILQWLGLQVTFVSNQQTMSKYWCSGRYLVLFTEFSQSPFIALNVGKNVNRGIFSFNDEQFSTDDISDNKFAKKWYLGSIEQDPKVDFRSFEITQLAKLVQALKPWLKIKEKALLSGVKQNKNETSDLSKNAKIKSPRSVAHANSSANDNPSFDLQKYADNQGSPALAVIMLEDYLADNQLQLNLLNTACQQTDKEEAQKQAQQAITQLSIQAKILAAEPLLVQLQELQQLLDNEKLPEIALELEYLQQTLNDIVSYAETI